jgi:hypothetical protein
LTIDLEEELEVDSKFVEHLTAELATTGYNVVARGDCSTNMPP